MRPPASASETQPTALKKLGPVDIPTFSTESAHHDACRDAAIRTLSGVKQTRWRTRHMAQMTQFGSGVWIAAVETMVIFAGVRKRINPGSLLPDDNTHDDAIDAKILH